MEPITCTENGGPLLGLTTKKLGRCQVRSGTARPCVRPATAKLQGVPFCGSCAREQEMYFAIGEFTEADEETSGENLAMILDDLKKSRARYQALRGSELDAA